MSPDGTSLIDDRLLEMTGSSRPRVCFIPTASGDAPEYADRFEAAFARRATTSVFTLFARDRWGLGDLDQLREADLIYVGGRSTANLLALWRLHGVDSALREAGESGTILAGISAGMNCWFEQSSTDSFGALAPLDDGLGLISGSACPHYLGEADRREKYLGWVADGSLHPGVAADDYAALVFQDGVLARGVAERSKAAAWRVERDGAVAVEHQIELERL